MIIKSIIMWNHTQAVNKSHHIKILKCILKINQIWIWKQHILFRIYPIPILNLILTQSPLTSPKHWTPTPKSPTTNSLAGANAWPNPPLTHTHPCALSPLSPPPAPSQCRSVPRTSAPWTSPPPSCAGVRTRTARLTCRRCSTNTPPLLVQVGMCHVPWGIIGSLLAGV